MKKTLLLLSFFFGIYGASAQNIRFSNGTFENGLTYPIADFSGNTDAKTTMNENILKIVSIYKDQDYCISQHGFVQHNNFVQLNFYFNCIDLDESKTESHLFSMTDGEIAQPSDLFSEDEKYQTFIRRKVSAHYAEHGKEVPESEFIDNLSINDCQVNLLKKGIELSLNSQENWPEQDLLITWSELSPYLKHLRTR